MATPTSSSNRSKRKGTKPVTKGQEPQRSNRQKVSGAKVTNDGTRGNSGARVTNASQRTNTGSARVTGTTPKALPPGNKGGGVTKANPGKTTATSKPAPVQQVRVRDLGTTKPNQMSGSTPRALPPGRTGGALARTARGAASAATKGGPNLLGRATLPLAIANQVSDVARVARQNQRWDEYKERTGLNKKTEAQTGGTRRGAAAGTRTSSTAKPTKPPLSSTGVRTATGNTVPTGSPEYNRYRNQQLADAKRRNESVRDTTPTRRASTTSSSGSGSSGSGSTSRSGGSSTRSQSSSRSQETAPRFTGTVDEGRQKWAEKYSSSKYDGQAIQKEAKKLLDEMKKRKEDKSNAIKAGWDGNKNY